MSRQRNSSQRGKNFEKAFVTKLQEAGIPCERVNRSSNYAESDYDIRITGFPELKIDCKSRSTSSHFTLFQTDVVDKYVKTKEDKAIMPFHLKGKKKGIVSISDDFFLELLLLYIVANKPVGDFQI